jgi:hypothetical protein
MSKHKRTIGFIVIAVVIIISSIIAFIPEKINKEYKVNRSFKGSPPEHMAGGLFFNLNFIFLKFSFNSGVIPLICHF